MKKIWAINVLLVLLLVSGARGQYYDPTTELFYYDTEIIPGSHFYYSEIMSFMDGNLLTILSQENTDNLVANFFIGNRYYYLDLYEDGGIPFWGDGSPLVYQNWAGAGPPTSFWQARVNGSTGLWQTFSQPGVRTVLQSTVELPAAVSELELIAGSPVRLTWVNSEAYDEIRIVQNGQLIATLDGNAELFDDFELNDPKLHYMVHGIKAGVAGLPALIAVEYRLSLPDIAATPGEFVQSTVLLDSPNALQGWSLGVRHDPNVLRVDQVEMGSVTMAVHGGDGPDFFTVNTFVDGYVVGTVFGLGSVLSDPGVNQEILVVTYEVLSDMAVESSIYFANDLGSPPVVTVVVFNGNIFPLALNNGVVNIVIQPFRRGDCNGDGLIDVADPIFLIAYLFMNDPAPNCMATAEFNNDGFIDIADAVFAINYLFYSGAQPAAPFPDCGTLQTVIDCENYSSCP